MKTTKSSFLSGALATNPIGAFATNPPSELEASTAKKKAQRPSQGEEKASAVESIAEEEGTPKLASLVEGEGKTTEGITELESSLQIPNKQKICSTATCSSIDIIKPVKKDARLLSL